MRVKRIKFDDLIKMDLKYFENTRIDHNDGSYKWKMIEKSLNELLLENREFWKEYSKTLALFVHTHNGSKPLSAWSYDQCYRDKYYCRIGSTIMYYPADMIYSRGKQWCVESPEPFKVEKEFTEQAFLVDLE